MDKIKSFFEKKDVIISAHRYGIDAMSAMAQGLFASLLIGTIIKTLGQQTGIEFLVNAGTYASSVADLQWQLPLAMHYMHHSLYYSH